MRLTTDNKFKKLIVIVDRELIRLTRPNERTESGLYLPPGVFTYSILMPEREEDI